MKRIYKFGLIALMFSFAACEDAYNIVQEGELGEEQAFRSVDDLNSGLSSAYAGYSPEALIGFSSIFTDEITRGINSGGQGADIYSFLLNGVSGEPGAIWSSRYITINRINRVLRNFDRVVATATPNQIQQANQIKAQLYALRAVCHFDIFQYFTPNYKDANSPSAIIMNFVPDINEVFPRNRAGEVLTFILSDLDASNALMAQSHTSGSFYLTKDAIDFLRAKVLLFRGDANDMDEVETIADEVLSAHAILTPDQFPDFWADANLSDVTEDIWTIWRGQGSSGPAALYYFNSTQLSGSPYLQMSNGLFDLYSSSDVRAFTYVDGSSDLAANPRIILIDKHPGSSRGQLTNHIKHFRASELMLIKAEAQARQGKLLEAAQSVQNIRANRIVPAPSPVNYGGLPDALTDILLERRKELAFEGHRYIDIKRIGREINFTMVRDPRDCAGFQTSQCSLPSSDYRFTMPIPQVETNPNPTIEQNPTY